MVFRSPALSEAALYFCRWMASRQLRAMYQFVFAQSWRHSCCRIILPSRDGYGQLRRLEISFKIWLMVVRCSASVLRGNLIARGLRGARADQLLRSSAAGWFRRRRWHSMLLRALLRAALAPLGAFVIALAASISAPVRVARWRSQVIAPARTEMRCCTPARRHHRDSPSVAELAFIRARQAAHESPEQKIRRLKRQRLFLAATNSYRVPCWRRCFREALVIWIADLYVVAFHFRALQICDRVRSTTGDLPQFKADRR